MRIARISKKNPWGFAAALFGLLCVPVFAWSQSIDPTAREEFSHLLRSNPTAAVAWVDSIAQHASVEDAELNVLYGRAYRASADYLKARLYFSKAQSDLLNTDNDSLTLRALIGLAGASYQLSYIDEAISTAEAALKIAIERDDVAHQTAVYTLLGNVLMRQNDLDGALAYFQRSLKMEEDENDSIRMASSYNNIGNVYLKQKQYDQAADYFNRTKEIDSVLGSELYLASDYNNIGVVFKAEGDYQRAERYQLRSLEINQRLGLDHGAAGNYNNLGNIYSKLGQEEEAEHYFKMALEMTDTLEVRSIRMDALVNLAQLYQQQGKHKEANELIWEMYEIKEQINNEKVYESLASYKNFEELMRKEQEVFQLKQQEELNRVKNDRIRLWYVAITLGVALVAIVLIWLVRVNSLKRYHRLEMDLQHQQLKAIRMQMNPHFLFNTLGAIGNYIEEHNAEEATRYLSKFSRLIRGFLESAESSSTEVGKEARLIRSYLELEQLRSAGAFDIEIDMDAPLEALRIPSMVLQPLVENAVLHGVRKLEGRKGKIHVRFQRQGDLVLCQIVDNGPGMRSNKSDGQHQSMGIALIKKRLSLLSKEMKQELFLQMDTSPELGGVRVVVGLGNGNFEST